MYIRYDNLIEHCNNLEKQYSRDAEIAWNFQTSSMDTNRYGLSILIFKNIALLDVQSCTYLAFGGLKTSSSLSSSTKSEAIVNEVETCWVIFPPKTHPPGCVCNSHIAKDMNTPFKYCWSHLSKDIWCKERMILSHLMPADRIIFLINIFVQKLFGVKKVFFTENYVLFSNQSIKCEIRSTASSGHYLTKDLELRRLSMSQLIITDNKDPPSHWFG